MSAGIRHVVMRLAMSDPDVDQDARDGEALRLLAGTFPSAVFSRDADGWTLFATDRDGHLAQGEGLTFAEAASDCRKAAEVRS